MEDLSRHGLSELIGWIALGVSVGGGTGSLKRETGKARARVGPSPLICQPRQAEAADFSARPIGPRVHDMCDGRRFIALWTR